MVSAARTVVIVGENERPSGECPYGEKQSRTDILRARLAVDVAEARGGRPPRMLFPPRAAADAADWNSPALRGAAGRTWKPRIPSGDTVPSHVPAPGR